MPLPQHRLCVLPLLCLPIQHVHRDDKTGRQILSPHPLVLIPTPTDKKPCPQCEYAVLLTYMGYGHFLNVFL